MKLLQRRALRKLALENFSIIVNGVSVFETHEKRAHYDETIIREAEDVLPYLDLIRDQQQEIFLCISLTGANQVISSRVVTTGLLDSNQVHPREVFCDPITDRAASIMIAHNHPSGTLEASPEDLAITKRLVKAGEILGIRVLDHIIVRPGKGHHSMKHAGEM